MAISSYYTQQRTEILELISKPPRNVLDIGCGKGGVALTIRNRYNRVSITGFDKHKDGTFDYKNIFDEFYDFDLDADWPDIDYTIFDTVLLLDVLEHLASPSKTLEQLSRRLSHQAQLVVSLPNFHFYSNLWEIVRSGRFRYRESGILDRTHLRFFGLNDARELIEEHFHIKNYLPHQAETSITSNLVKYIFGNTYSAYQHIFLCTFRK